MENQTVKDIMTADPVCCTPDSDLRAVSKMMCENACGEIPVVDSEASRKIVGVVTDRDITCRTVARGKNPIGLKAKDCMSSPAVTVSPDTSLEQVCRVMEDHKIRRVPVVDEDGRCCGIVAQADIALKAPQKAPEVLRELSHA